MSLEHRSQNGHPLEKWMPKRAFALVKPFVMYSKNTDLENLLIEEHVEITLNMETLFEKSDDEEDEEFPELYSLKYLFRFEGKNTDTCIEIADLRGYDCRKLKQVRDILLDKLASLCTSVERLTIRSSLDGLPAEYYREQNIVNEDFVAWADAGLVLKSFAKAAFWTVSLQQLGILGDTELPRASDIEDSVFLTKPQNLKVLRLSLNDYDEEEDVDLKAKTFVEAFPTLETLRIHGKVGKAPFNFYLPSFFRGLGISHPCLTAIHIEGEDEVIDLGGHRFVELVFELLNLRGLEHLTIDLKGTQKHGRYYSDAAMEILRFTDIKEITLKGLSASSNCFDYLIEHLSKEDCRLRYFDIETDCLEEQQLAKLLKLLSLKETRLPATNDLKTLDALLVLRRFQEVVPSNFNQTAKLWPLLLANAGKWKQQMKSMGKTAASRWFFSRDRLAPTLMYSLIRERVDILSDHLAARTQTQKEGKIKDDNLNKRPHEEEAANAKRAKVVETI